MKNYSPTNPVFVWQNRPQNKRGIQIIGYFLLILCSIAILGPLLITTFAVFKTPAQIAADFPLKPPTRFYLENLKYAFSQGNFLLGFRNSLFIVGLSLMANIFIGSMTAYILGRFEFKLKKLIMGLFVLGMLIPGIISEIARFSVIKGLGIYNTIWAPIVIYIATDMMQLYIYFQFLSSISESLDESILIDGGSYFTVYWRIIFPLMLPATATLAIIKAIVVFNDMFIPYLYMPSQALRTLTTTLMDFNNALYGSFEYLSAGIILVAIPTVAIYLLLQKYIFEGIVSGAVKE